MDFDSLKKKTKPENVVTVARISSDVLNVLKLHKINISKTTREHLTKLANGLNKKFKKAS